VACVEGVHVSTRDKRDTTPIYRAPTRCSFVDGAVLSGFLGQIVNFLSSFNGRLGLPENADPLRGTWEPQLDAHPLVQGRRDRNLPNLMFGVNV
jgi:hypothetical protein